MLEAQEQIKLVPGSEPTRKDEQAFVDEMLYLFKAPVITWPGYEDDVEWDKVFMERLVHSMQHKPWPSDYELALYLSQCSLVAPLDATFSKIYMAVFAAAYPEKAKTVFKDEPAPVLQDWERQELERFKAWMLKRQNEHLKTLKSKKPKRTLPTQITLSSFLVNKNE